MTVSQQKRQEQDPREERVGIGDVKRQGCRKKDKEKWITRKEGSENISKNRELGNQKIRQ